ncbi:hypothetical protein [Streptomyces turgidiscabies]|uniref:Uncharacterized protein n=1 Tax=Streptomyces turgidiscabies TaxID=85558 RepID=A0ABU0RQD2_9ACTN|nr:hypothetical protein [Streptomyces turgidiscabies]MDQ0934181.1 hypothetical protein [Streptomyces turgidiscabies]
MVVVVVVVVVLGVALEPDGLPGAGGIPDALREGFLRYEHLKAAALPVEASAELIARVIEERYGHKPGPVGSAVAQVLVQQ